jgi:adenosylcobinamide kinase/adenosylcobinamide-phosphate guanylyltransferase
MSRTILVLGGTRSGKSGLAESLTDAFGSPLCYLATAAAGDDEMAQRIARHRSRRGDKWQTLEEPLDLASVITRHDGQYAAMLIDCVTLWLTNLLLTHDDPELAIARVKELTGLFPELKTPLIFVSSEVGMGIVPENRLARTFRDLAGEANQMLAQAADEVHLSIAGIPLKIKG